MIGHTLNPKTMKKFAVAIYQHFEDVPHMFKVEAEDQIDSIKKALFELYKNDEHTLTYWKTYRFDNIEFLSLIDELREMELSVVITEI